MDVRFPLRRMFIGTIATDSVASETGFSKEIAPAIGRNGILVGFAIIVLPRSRLRVSSNSRFAWDSPVDRKLYRELISKILTTVLESPAIEVEELLFTVFTPKTMTLDAKLCSFRVICRSSHE